MAAPLLSRAEHHAAPRLPIKSPNSQRTAEDPRQCQLSVERHAAQFARESVITQRVILKEKEERFETCHVEPWEGIFFFLSSFMFFIKRGFRVYRKRGAGFL